jgi:hypothetical protein
MLEPLRTTTTEIAQTVENNYSALTRLFRNGQLWRHHCAGLEWASRLWMTASL